MYINLPLSRLWGSLCLELGVKRCIMLHFGENHKHKRPLSEATRWRQLVRTRANTLYVSLGGKTHQIHNNRNGTCEKQKGENRTENGRMEDEDKGTAADVEYKIRTDDKHRKGCFCKAGDSCVRFPLLAYIKTYLHI